ncbi:MAG: comEC [Solimicrobium sp.]|jgi:competence protein ComEC|nr:comEC [Solimicrobium sp.]
MRSVVIGFTLGILLLQQQQSLWNWPALISLGCLIAILLLIKRKIRRTFFQDVLSCILGGLLGWIWASVIAINGLSHHLVAELEEQDIAVIGVITSLPSRVEYGQRFEFSIEHVLTEKVDRRQFPRKVMLSLYAPRIIKQESKPTALLTTLQPGERWRFTVRLRRPHGLANPYGFDYEVWMLEQGVNATGSVKSHESNQRLSHFVFSFNNCIEWARGKLRERILNALPDQPYAPVIVALVIGEQNAITQNDWKVFSRTGVSHLIAISGLHVTLVSGIFASLMFYLWRKSFFTRYQLPLILPAQKVAVLSGFFMALVYVALAGFGVPAQRTLIMAGVATLACLFNRISSVTNVLCLALGIVILVDPWAVLAPGFWLSFGAVGLLFYVSLGRSESKSVDYQNLASPKITSLKVKLYKHFQQASVAQYAITLGLVPLTMLLFNQVSLISPIANAIAIPVVSFLVTPCALMGSLLPAPLGTGILIVTNYVLHLLIIFLAWLSEFSWAIWQAPRPKIWMLCCALLGTAWCLAPKGWPLRWAGLLAWLPLCLNSSVYSKPNEFKVTAFDVGQGTAVLIETERHRMLYDTGPVFSSQSDAGSSVIYPYLKMRGIQRLDGLMISHSDIDHAGGALTLMQQLPIKWISSSLKLDSNLVQIAEQLSTHTTCLAGQAWEWDGIQFEVLHPYSSMYTDAKSKPNSMSCTLKITNGRQSILLAGDIEAKQEYELIKSNLKKLASTVLLVPHHGSGTSSTDEFLRSVNPKIAIFQLGYHNRYHHPKPIVWQRYSDFNITRFRTDQAGAITVNFGDEISVEEHRVAHGRYWYTKMDVD